MKTTVKHVIVTEKPGLFTPTENMLVVRPHTFISQEHTLAGVRRGARVVNLSGSYEYLSLGYYVSLLAEARRLPCIPKVSNIVSLNWRRHHAHTLPELNEQIDKLVGLPYEEPAVRTYTSFFGRHADSRIEPLTRKIFDLFRFPIFTFELKYTAKQRWAITHVAPGSFNNLLAPQLERFMLDFQQFTGSAWRTPSSKVDQERYWLAILHNPTEGNPPSSMPTLHKFVKVAKRMGVFAELITKEDYPSLLEFDGLFIRETTSINHHTYRFAQKAESEGIPTMEDTQSIIRCCNKIFLNELLDIHNINRPKSWVLDKKSLPKMKDELVLPAVIKIPDGAFSFGVFKVENEADLIAGAKKLFQKSELLLLQEFVPSEYDWRIGVLNNEPLFATKYFMAKGHWQIYNHAAKKSSERYGHHEAIAIDQVPTTILALAAKVSTFIGDGLYGLDIKQLPDGRIMVIEINDNPNIDMGVEDEVLGDRLYERVLQHLIGKMQK